LETLPFGCRRCGRAADRARKGVDSLQRGNSCSARSCDSSKPRRASSGAPAHLWPRASAEGIAPRRAVGRDPARRRRSPNGRAIAELAGVILPWAAVPQPADRGNFVGRCSRARHYSRKRRRSGVALRESAEAAAAPWGIRLSMT
jgi:hypothetical protein